MTIYNNVPLKKYNTFGLDYRAESMIHLKSRNETQELFRDGGLNKRPVLILGGGSNILFTADFKGLVLHIEFDGIKIEAGNAGDITVSAGAGVQWDKLVEWTVNQGYSGLENLSFIPGTVGASPVQNIGAYGVEVRDSIDHIETICLTDGSLREFSNSECKFGYRTSTFKNSEKGRYLVYRVYFKLTDKYVPNLSYGSLKEEVNKIGYKSLSNVRQAVINIRKSKLPDPDKIGNAGSFFKNPVVSRNKVELLKTDYPSIPLFDDDDDLVKLAAGWLIEQCGWKGKRSGDAGVHEKQALVLVNYGRATGQEIYALSESIRKSVLEKFGISLEREAEVIGTI